METAVTSNSAANPRVLAIVVTFNAMRWADRCFGSLLSSSLRPDVLAVDNGSDDGTCEYLAAEFPEVEVLGNPENLGFGAANNLGLGKAVEEDYDFVYLMNQDAWVEKDTLNLLVRAHRPEFGVLSPLQLSASGVPDANFYKKCGRSLERAGFGLEPQHGRSSEGTVQDIVELPFVMAAHWLVSREALLTVGGFSPAFRQYGEDDNFIDRLHWHGFSCGVVPEAKAVHDRGGRPLPKSARMRLKCVAPVVRLSDPGRCLPLYRVLAPLELMAMSVKNLSSYPLKRLPELLRRYPELKRLRELSKSAGAFL